MVSKKIEDMWTNKAKDNLVGRKIVGARYMSEKEMKEMCWYSRCIVLLLDDGSLIYPSRDDEGNDAGALFGQGPDGEDLSQPVL